MAKRVFIWVLFLLVFTGIVQANVCEGYLKNSCQYTEFEYDGLNGVFRLSIEGGSGLRPTVFLYDDWGANPIESISFGIGGFTVVDFTYENGFEYLVSGNTVTLLFTEPLSAVGEYDGGIAQFNTELGFSSKSPGGSSGLAVEEAEPEEEIELGAQDDTPVPEFSNVGIILSITIIGTVGLYYMRK